MSDDGSLSALPTPEQILSALDRTGFVLEHRVAQTLRESGFDAFLNHTFVDPESGKSREMDVLATVTESVSGDHIKILVSSTLIIECKNYSDPLVVIGESNKMMFHNEAPLVTFDPLLIDFANRPHGEHGDLRNELGVWRLPSHATRGFIGRQLIRMHRNSGKWQATNDSIYDSIIYPLAKAVEYERTLITGNATLDDTDPWFLPTLTYIFPVLVTAGSIFAVDVVPDRAPTVTSKKWVPLVRLFGDSAAFLMDVVGFGCIDEYLQQRVFPPLNDAKRALTPRTEIFNPEWLQQQYGESLDPVFVAWLKKFKSSQDSPD